MSATARSGEKRLAQPRDQGRVLLITDDAATNACVATLEGAGLAVFGVEGGGAAALVALQRTRPHVVVADVSLKGISAGELARSLARVEDATPVVFIGAAPADAARRVQAIADGAFDYFQVPAESALLVARLGQLVRIRQTIDRLRAEADLDALTGLANRRRFRKSLDREVERWRRYAVPCALLLLDVDHMKKINDTHGHPAGDLVICAVAAALSQHSRDNDTSARLGGEEFGLLLAGADERNAAAAAERVRRAIAEMPVEGVGQFTVSIGVANCPGHARSERELFAASDGALYRAKQLGRDRVEVADGAADLTKEN
ncbi:MAG TPA: diguanylate cyclase [Pyrinomonadaceae bacterium]